MALTMKVFPNRQNWLVARQNYIGGSEASAIVGMNPYQTNVELWEIKTGRRKAVDISGKPYVKYGTDAEDYLRELFKLDYPQYQVEYADNNMWFNDNYPFAHSSLDGWLIDEKCRKGILEIKTTEISQSMQKEKWNKQVPMNYYCQVLHYMMVCEADFAIIKAQLKSHFDGVPYLQTRHYHIEREDVTNDIIYLAEQESKFWWHVQKDKPPALILPSI